MAKKKDDIYYIQAPEGLHLSYDKLLRNSFGTVRQIRKPLTGDLLVKTITDSDSIQHRLDETRTRNTAASYGKLKEIRVKGGGNVRVSWEMRNASGNLIEAKIYINDVAVDSTNQTTTSTTFTLKTVNNLVMSPNDKISLYVKNDFGGTTEVRNYRISYTEITTPIRGEGLTDTSA